MSDIENMNTNSDIDKLTEFCLIDVGSTTTKAILFRKDREWKYNRQEAPTTVEKPYEDVTFGVINALKALEEQTGAKLLDNNIPCIPCFSTSSAGGGLAVVVAGLVAEVTAKSAERVALGAGAIVQDVIALNDDRTAYKKIEAMKILRPDMVLLAGGFNNGTVHGPVYLAELLNQSGLRPKLSERGKLPVIYAGNERAREYVDEQLSDQFIYHPVPNLRPSDYRENLDPAREAIHEVFMDHVMSKAPGYDKYKKWISAPILPTPAAVSRILELVSKDMQKKILAVDIGGATTDIFTAENGRVFRTVSANLGMSYSILNVVRQGGLDSLTGLLDLDMTREEILDRIGNKYLRPTKLPDNIDDTIIECGAASLAIREAIKEHLSVLHGMSLSLTEEDLSRSVIKRKKKTGKLSSKKPALDYDLIIGSGGKLSHSPRETAAMILTNALQSEGTMDLAVDSVFMFPQLGVLSQENPELAIKLFYKFGLVRLGKLVALSGKAKPGKKEVKVKGGRPSSPVDQTVPHGQVKFIPVTKDDPGPYVLKTGRLKINDKKITTDTECDNLIIDARGRPAVAGSDYFLPESYIPDTRGGDIEIHRRIHTGEIKETREMAVSGDVFVKQGQEVSSDTIIAKSSRTFLRPFFFHISDTLGIAPEDVPSCFLKKVGESIEPGEIIAQKKTGVINVKDFVSPVSAVIEKIQASGTVIARERPDFARKSYTVDVAKDLDTKPAKINAQLNVKVGQELEKGQLVAGNPATGYSKVSRSPIRGKVTDIALDEGTVTIEPLLEELELNAWLPGRVEEISDRGCLIANNGSIIQGIWGHGGQVHGKITTGDGCPGEIVYRENTTRQDLEKLMSNQVEGLVTGSIHLNDFDELAPLFTIVITEGFGTKKMNKSFSDLIRAHEGRIAAIDAATQLRAGVKRPRIILPQTGS